MALFEIPYEPEDGDGWKVPIPGDGCRQFASREGALTFARSLAKQRELIDQDNYLCVEGGDGIWRLFTPDLLPVKS